MGRAESGATPGLGREDGSCQVPTGMLTWRHSCSNMPTVMSQRVVAIREIR